MREKKGQHLSVRCLDFSQAWPSVREIPTHLGLSNVALANNPGLETHGELLAPEESSLGLVIVLLQDQALLESLFAGRETF